MNTCAVVSQMKTTCWKQTPAPGVWQQLCLRERVFLTTCLPPLSPPASRPPAWTLGTCFASPGISSPLWHSFTKVFSNRLQSLEVQHKSGPGHSQQLFHLLLTGAAHPLKDLHSTMARQVHVFVWQADYSGTWISYNYAKIWGMVCKSAMFQLGLTCSLQEDGLGQDGSALSRRGGLGVDKGDCVKEVLRSHLACFMTVIQLRWMTPCQRTKFCWSLSWTPFTQLQ